MELKQLLKNSLDFQGIKLLIVPYGIETLYTMKCSSTPYLLIVPYGIETSQNAKILKITIFF